MKTTRFFLLAAALAGAVSAATAPATPTEKKPAKSDSDWVFSLLPKSLQKNPQLELTVITEMTDAGRKLPPVTPQQPAYFEPFSGGPKHLGDTTSQKYMLKQAEIERVLFKALASSGYLPAKAPEHPPGLVIIYTWGSHNLLNEADAENPSNSAEMVARNLLDRAAMVGGEKFAKELLRLFEQADALSIAARAPVAPDGNAVITPEMVAFMNPVEMFKRQAAKNEMLVDQAAADIYYVVATAYDYKAMAQNRRLVLWRTRMTVSSAGVSAEQAMPTMVLNAGPYFGKEMKEAEVTTKRSLRDANVEIGTATVVESDAKAPPPTKKK